MTLLSRVTGLRPRHGLARLFGAGAGYGRLPGRPDDPEPLPPAVRRRGVFPGLRAGDRRVPGRPAPTRTSGSWWPASLGTLGVFVAVVTWSGVLPRPFLLMLLPPGSRRTRQVRPGRRDAALDLPLSVLHLADGARRRGAEQLRAVRRAGVHPGDPEPVPDRFAAVHRCAAPVRVLAVARVRGGHPPARIPAARRCCASACCHGRAGTGAIRA